MSVLARVAQRRMGRFSAQGLSILAWAFATASKSDAVFFAIAHVQIQCAGARDYSVGVCGGFRSGGESFGAALGLL